MLESCQLMGDAQLWVHRVANALSAAGTRLFSSLQVMQAAPCAVSTFLLVLQSLGVVLGSCPAGGDCVTSVARKEVFVMSCLRVSCEQSCQ